MKIPRLNIALLLLTLVVLGALVWGATRISYIDTDITRFLPQDERVLADAGYIFTHHPIQAEMAIDLCTPEPAPEDLVQAADYVEQRLRASGLFLRVGTESMQALIPALVEQVNERLPLLFTQTQLEQLVAPLVTPERITERLVEIHTQLLSLDSIGQARMLAQDPLGVKNVVMAQLALLAPSGQIEFYRGKLLSPDHRHLLVVATPKMPGTDTAFALKLDSLMREIGDELQNGDPGSPVTMTPMGAYRAALDNENLAKQDVRFAAIFSTIGISLLLLLTFPRPLIGLFSFLPAVAGTSVAFFIMALFNKSISIMALGFGGAIVGITVDQGIAYLLFLDQSRTTSGQYASDEIYGLELMVTLTTVGAFMALCLTGFPILSQLGQFTALSAAFAFIFVHYVFPKIFSEMPAAPARPLPFPNVVKQLTAVRKTTAWVSVGFCLAMLWFARPVFNTDISSMNTVSRATAAAEKTMLSIWGGGLFNKCYLMIEAFSPEELQANSDRLLTLIEEDIRAGRIAAGFAPGVVFPGPERTRENFQAWQSFWTPTRIASTMAVLREKGQAAGFTADAFNAFQNLLSADKAPPSAGPTPEQYYSLMGIARTPEGQFSQFISLTPGPHYNGGWFMERYGTVARIFDPGLFSQHLGDVLFNTFVKMLMVAGISVAVLILIFLLDLKLALITLVPAVFAQICTMGSLKLVGRQLDISVLMLAIIIMGMGIDYGLLLVCSYQRFGGLNKPGCERIKTAMLMGAFSALIGFAVLCFAKHSLLRSAGLTSFLGIGFSLVGAFVLLPPLLEHHFRHSRTKTGKAADWPTRVLGRYRDLETYPRLFAKFKLKYDPMFAELPRLLHGMPDPQVVLDIGCGFGLPGCWVLERFATARVYGIDPDRGRIRVAARVFAERGGARCDMAPNIPAAPVPANLVLMLDMIHFLDDADLLLTLRRVRSVLAGAGVLVLRAVVPPPNGKGSWYWYLDALKMRKAGITGHYRTVERITEIMAAAALQCRHSALSGGNPESVWIVAGTPTGTD